MKFIRSKIDYVKNKVVLYYEKDGEIVKKYQSFNKLAPFTEKKDMMIILNIYYRMMI